MKKNTKKKKVIAGQKGKTVAKLKSKKSKKMLKKDSIVFKKILIELKGDMIDQIKHISEVALKTQKEAAGDISGYTLHMADVATDSYDREFSLGLASNDRELLYQIDDSLKRIEDGSYGICESCDKSIAKKRLKAIPYTRLCLKCQKDLEKK